MKLVNLTPHIINIFSEDGVYQVAQIEPSGDIARCGVTNTRVGEYGEIPLFRPTFGEVEGLPEPSEETVYIVSLMVRTAVPDRNDVASPGDLLRDENGNPKGCKGLSVN